MEKNTAIFLIRTALEMRQRQMITFLETEQSNYSLIEAGKGRKMTDKMMRLAEIHFKASPDYLKYKVGNMFTVDYPLYSQRILMVCNALNITPDTMLYDIKDIIKRDRMKRVLKNDEPPDYELLKFVFNRYDGVNYDFLIDATGSPVIKPGSNEKQFYKTFEDDDLSSIAMEAMRAYKRLADDKEVILTKLQAENEELKKSIDLLKQKLESYER